MGRVPGLVLQKFFRVMTFFEDQIESIVSRMEEVLIFEDALDPSRDISRSVKFEWGNSEDLNRFLIEKGEENSVPLIWSVPREDSKLPWGDWERTAELNFCAFEDRTDLLNTQRLKDSYSFKQVLSPMWEDFKKKLRTSGNVRIIEESTKRTLYPNFVINDSRDPMIMWDVMKVKFKTQYSEPATLTGCLK